MNKKTRHDLLFLLIIIVLAIGIGMIINGVNKESFIPAINGFYRPYARHAHNYASKKWDHITSGCHRFMKSFGLK
jgi:hypothetical protein